MSSRTKRPRPNVTPPQPQRLTHLDNLRASLTVLVIYHHVATSYGGIGFWPYMSRSPLHASESSLPLITFNILNQTFFMAAFFFLSGFFSARALARKSAREFLRVKFLKLGLPTLVFTLIGPLLCRAIVLWGNGAEVSWRTAVQYWCELRGVRGPVWYLGIVLIFDVIYAFVLSTSDPTTIGRLTTWLPFPVAFCLVITTSFILRLWYPVGDLIKLLNLQPAYLPQYIAAYLLGTWHHHHFKASRVPPLPLSKPSQTVFLAGSIFSTVTALAYLVLYPDVYTICSLRGGANIPALLYAIWNETTGYLLGVHILRLFSASSKFNCRWGNLARYSYAAFLVHPVVCMAVQVAFDGWEVGGVWKTAVVGSFAVVGSWAVGWVMVDMTAMGRVLV